MYLSSVDKGAGRQVVTQKRRKTTGVDKTENKEGAPRGALGRAHLHVGQDARCRWKWPQSISTHSAAAARAGWKEVLAARAWARRPGPTRCSTVTQSEHGCRCGDGVAVVAGAGHVWAASPPAAAHCAASADPSTSSGPGPAAYARNTPNAARSAAASPAAPTVTLAPAYACPAPHTASYDGTDHGPVDGSHGRTTAFTPCSAVVARGASAVWASLSAPSPSSAPPTHVASTMKCIRGGAAVPVLLLLPAVLPLLAPRPSSAPGS